MAGFKKMTTVLVSTVIMAAYLRILDLDKSLVQGGYNTCFIAIFQNQKLRVDSTKTLLVVCRKKICRQLFVNE